MESTNKNRLVSADKNKNNLLEKERIKRRVFRPWRIESSADVFAWVGLLLRKLLIIAL